MTKLIALLAVAGAVGVGLFFWRRNEKSWRSIWSASAREAGNAVDRVVAAAGGVTNAAHDLADVLTGGASRVAQEAGKAADSAAASSDSVINEVSNIADEVKSAPSQES
jgi:hypothetical protein